VHGFEPIAGERAMLGNGVQAQVGKLVLLEVGPGGLDRIEFRHTRQQGCHGDVAIQHSESGIELSAATNGRRS
jgi:hypothetical protein